MKVVLTYLVRGHKARFAKYILSPDTEGVYLPITGPFIKEEIIDIDDCEEVVRLFHLEALCMARRKIKNIASAISSTGLCGVKELRTWTAVYECACRWLMDVIDVPVTYRYAVVKLGTENVAYVVHPREVDGVVVFRDTVFPETSPGYINEEIGVRGGVFIQRITSPMVDDAKVLGVMLNDIVERNEHLKEKASKCNILAV